MARCYLVTQKFNLFQFDLICGYVATLLVCVIDSICQKNSVVNFYCKGCLCVVDGKGAERRPVIYQITGEIRKVVHRCGSIKTGVLELGDMAEEEIKKHTIFFGLDHNLSQFVYS